MSTPTARQQTIRINRLSKENDLLSIGVIGQYIGKTYVEVKERPRYNIDVLLESKSVGKEND